MECWLEYVERTRTRLGLQPREQILEVGCGAGAFLRPLNRDGAQLFGIDHAESLLKVCEHVIPNGTFTVADAALLPFEKKAFDVVVSNSVFQYFPDEAYAATVLAEVCRVLKAGGRVGLLDIGDRDKKDACEASRRREIGEEMYERLYRVLKHQYYEKGWFTRFAEDCGLSCAIEDQNIPGYGNAPFRFNVFFQK